MRGRLLREVARRRGEQYPHDKTMKLADHQDDDELMMTVVVMTVVTMVMSEFSIDDRQTLLVVLRSLASA